MMTLSEANDVVMQIISDHGRGFDWLCYSRFRHCVSAEAKVLAVNLLSNDALHTQLKLAIEKEIQGRVHRDWVERATALLLDDDANGNHITVADLLIAKHFRMYCLGMAY